MSELNPYGIYPYRFSAVNGWKIPHEVIQELGVKFDQTMRPGAIGTVYRKHNEKEYTSSEMINTIGTTYFCHCLSRGAIGCMMSHLSILQDAYDSGYNLIWIMEDDIEVVQNPRILIEIVHELDQKVGRNNWHVLFTDQNYRVPGGHLSAMGADHRPNLDTRDQRKFNVERKISTTIKRVAARFGTHSMIWTRSGIELFLKYIKVYKIFLPYDLDLHMILIFICLLGLSYMG